MSDTPEEILARLIERVDGRYFGKYRGVVKDNVDPNNLGRITATVPRLLGAAVTGWALPAFPYGGAKQQGLFTVPDIGALVWIEFEGGDLSYPIWTGAWYPTGAIPDNAAPSKKVLMTKAGHKIVLDDGTNDNDKSVLIQDSNGNKINMTKDGITITGAGQTISMTKDGVSINNGALVVKT